VILDVKFLIFSKGREEDKEGVILDIFPRLLPPDAGPESGRGATGG
jgi:hypothetical protein